ncbi:MAG: site-specific integrase, partial [Methanomassiliicoccales archaeon]
RLLRSDIEKYLSELTEGGRSSVTIRDYRYTLNKLFQALNDSGREINPRKVTREDILFLKDEFLTGGERYKKNAISILLSFLKWSGNTESTKWRFGYGDISPKNIRWLTDEQAALVRLEARGIERIIVHLELDLGLRRCGVLNLKLKDFYRGRQNTIHVLEKGRNGGKPRIIPWDPQTEMYLAEYLELREREIEEAKKKNPDVKIPENLLIYERGGKLHPYRKSAINKILEALGKRLGFPLSNHDLRRTCGRQMYFSGVPIEKIAMMLGHSDTKTTLHYLGINTDDLAEAQKTYARYRSALNRAFFEKASVVSGPSGI